MGLSFSAADLLSRLNRKAKTLATSPVGKNLVNGVIQNQVSFANYMKGFAISTALSAIPHLVWSITAVWDLFVQAALFVYYFDWNIPDSSLDAMATSQWRSYAGLLGGSVGNTLGWLGCGVLPATSIMAVNESMGAYVLREVGTEAFEEFTFNVAYVLRFTLTTLAQQGFYQSYKNIRKWLKDDSNPFLDRMFPGRANDIRQNWGASDSDSFTFAGEVEERIEKIPSEFWRNFTEELVEEAFDACIEAGYVVANSIDGYLAQQKLANRLDNDRLRVVEVKPDRSNDRETVIIAGPEAATKAALTQTIAHYQMIDNRDVGQIVAQPLDDYVREKDLTLRLKFQLFSESSPPYSHRSKNRFIRAQITVPDIKRSALDWDKFKFALGGVNGYLWGPYRAIGRIDGGRYVRVYAASASEAEDRLRAVMTLSTAELKTINVSKQVRDLERVVNDRLYNSPQRIYPGYVTVVNRARIIAADKGRVATDGNFLDRFERFDLWRQAKPADFEIRVAELLRFSTLSGDTVP
jgi:hypothetical protein